MNELVHLFNEFNICLEQQISIFCGFEDLLNHEEQLIAEYNLQQYELILIQKDQIVQRALAVEKRRQSLQKKICYFIAYDLRAGLPNITTMGIAIENYINNVNHLVDECLLEKIIELNKKFSEVRSEYIHLFSILSPRIERNKIILQKIRSHIQGSVTILSQSDKYNKSGVKQTDGKMERPNIKIRA